MPRITAFGLESDESPEASLNFAGWAPAAGSADVITAAFSPSLTALLDGTIVAVRHSVTNATPTPSLNVDTLGAKVITKTFDAVLEPGDIPAEAFYRYDLAEDCMVLLNPNPQFRQVTEWAVASGTVDAIAVTCSPVHSALKDGQVISFRAAGANATTTPTLSVDTFTARIIKKQGAQALVPGDIFGASHEVSVRYHAAVTPWFELLNPATAAPSDPTFGVKFVELTADAATLADDTSAHPIVGLGVTLGVGQYQFSGKIHTTRTAGTTAHTTSFSFAGTATLTDARFVVRSRGGDAQALAANSSVRFESAAAQVVKASSTSATEDLDLEIEGTITVSVAGTLLPELTHSVAAGGVTTPKAGCQFTFTPRVNPQGTWA